MKKSCDWCRTLANEPHQGWCKNYWTIGGTLALIGIITLMILAIRGMK